MCDYSLCGIPNRLATEDDQLALYRFRTGSMGLAAVSDLEREILARENRAKGGWWTRFKTFIAGTDVSQIPAVCVPPGARLVARNIPEDLRKQLDVADEEDVVFVQTSMEANTYRDAIQFRNGRQMRLQNLPSGLRMDVVSLSGSVFTFPEERAALLQE